MASPSTPRVRVVVVNWNSGWFTARCVRSLLRTDWPSDRIEVVVVDNGSVDGSLELLRYQFPGLRTISNGSNLGFAEGCNRAMRDLDGIDYVALVNNDAEVDPGWLRPLADTLDRDPGLGAAAACLVLEPEFVPVDVEVTGGSFQIDRVQVGSLEVTSRTQFVSCRAVGDIYWPMNVTHHVDGRARLLVPAGAGNRQIAVTVTGRGFATARTAASTRQVDLKGESVRVELETSDERIELLNGLGTDRGEDSEGFDRYFGAQEVSRATEEVPGFCGGGVLLRTEMLSQVGLFDPGFFAYYEDMDLSWRATRAGWRIATVPESVIRHSFGGSGGSASPAFFFLNYRNWLMTVLRNADRDQRRRAFRSAWDRIKWAIRSNIVSPMLRGRKPRLRLSLAWGRVVLASLLAVPRLGVLRGSATVPGASPTNAVRGPLQPDSRPGTVEPRPGGPLVVFVDVSSWFEVESVSEAAKRTVEELIDVSRQVQPLFVRLAHGSASPRRLTPHETARVLSQLAGDPVPTAVEEPQSDTTGAVYVVRSGIPGTTIIELDAEGGVTIEGAPTERLPGVESGVVETLLARFGTP